MKSREAIRQWQRMSLLLLVGWLLAGFIFPAHGANPEEAFQQANKLYEQGRFPEAAAAYDHIAETSGVSPGLLFNLGNARLKAGHVGLAIQAYRRAKAMAPRDPDVRANLNFARDQAGNGPSGSRWTRWLEILTVNECTALASGALVLWFLLLTVGQWKIELGKTVRPYTRVAGIVCVGLVVCVGTVLQARVFTRTVVVVTPEAVVRRGPFDESQTAFTARDGTELAVLGRKDDWVEVNDPQNRVGWVQLKQILFLK